MFVVKSEREDEENEEQDEEDEENFRENVGEKN